MAKSASEQIEKKILNTLQELGGQTVKEDEIQREGSKFIIPETMGLMDAMRFLKNYIEVQNEVTAFQKTFQFRPKDGAYAVQAALKEVFGSAGIPRATRTIFGDKPPQLISIHTSYDKTEQVPWGQVELPFVKGMMTINQEKHEEFGELFHLVIQAPRKYAQHIEGLFKVIEDQLEKSSIYRGKAINGEFEFLDLTGIDKNKVIYTDEVKVQLEANVWALPKHTNKIQELDIPLKRAVLLEGPYGVGKTLAAFLTAQIATDNDWTFVYCRPGRDDLVQVMQTARLYSPAVVFFEDMDRIASGEQDGVTKLLDIFDGITAKGTKILAVLTTNFPDRIHKGMIRPGRLDAVIHIGALDEGSIEEMIRKSVEPTLLGDVDYNKVATAMEGFLPAFIKEAIDRTMMYALARGQGEINKLETDDFVRASNGLRDHLKLMEGATEGKGPDSLSVALRNEIKEVFQSTSLVDINDETEEYSRLDPTSEKAKKAADKKSKVKP